ncbi:hypothetical protein TVAGG3_0832800 [Trichomonas vaginalis G3]|uniref:hypothetical protein n=1 Tax=Trichomonas vaginalis (strain ATCC PRA-98 / G3) TaxID=412133 RepID=UPI0021E56D87|nr:hypothetical protein TVAGG3_0832800 [Trichomonas vaginalis G3]KAI5498702.1 hypothetical protein TVAGG3_0832800 [Trichomonas vaginalis G3]
MSVKTNDVKKLGFTNEEINEILDEAGIEVSRYYLRNCQKFAELLNDLDYEGEMNKDDVINFLYPTSDGNEEKPQSGGADVHEKLKEVQEIDDNVYEERRGEDEFYEQDEKKAEEVRNEIDEEIKNEKEVEEYMNEINKGNLEMDEEYERELNAEAMRIYEDVKSYNDDVKERIEGTFERLDKNPFGEKLDLRIYGKDELRVVDQKLKEFYEKHIMTQPIERKILVHYIVNGQERSQPIDKESFRQRFEQMLNGQFIYKIEELSGNISDDGTKLYLEFFDVIYFTIHDKIKKPANAKNMKESNFWCYRLKKGFEIFEPFLKRYQIFTKLTNENNECREEMKYNCLLYALSFTIKDENLLVEISNRFLDSKYCPTNVLSKICDEYKIKCVLRYVDDKVVR